MGREKLHTEMWLKTLRERDHLVDSGTDRRILKRLILKKRNKCMDWIYLAQDRDR